MQLITIDDLPIFGYIGTTNDYETEGIAPKYYIAGNLDFMIEYNGDQV